MTWCNTDQSTTTTAASQDETGVHNPFQVIPVHRDSSQENTSRLDDDGGDVVGTVTCPSCGHHIQVRAHEEQVRILQDLPGLPAGVKFDPTDQEILEHLEAKVEFDSGRLHPLIDEFIPTIEGENGICYTHPEKLPGVNKDGQIRHFFHRPSKAYTTGTRKRRKVHTDTATTTTTAEAEGGGSTTTGETRWHKTGKTRPIFIGSIVKGFKKILVLYTNYGRQRKPEKTNWVMHQYHLGHNEEEKEGELVVSKVFFQTQPRQCGGSSSNVKEPEIPAPGKPTSLVENISATSFSDFYNIPAVAPPPPPLPLPFSYDLGDQSGMMIPNLQDVHGDGSSFIHLPSGASKGK